MLTQAQRSASRANMAPGQSLPSSHLLDSFRHSISSPSILPHFLIINPHPPHPPETKLTSPSSKTDTAPPSANRSRRWKSASTRATPAPFAAKTRSRGTASASGVVEAAGRRLRVGRGRFRKWAGFFRFLENGGSLGVVWWDCGRMKWRLMLLVCSFV